MSVLPRARLDRRWDLFEMLVRAVRKDAPMGCVAVKELDEMLKTAIRRDEKTSEERDALIAGTDVDTIMQDSFNVSIHDGPLLSAAPLLSWAIQKGWTNSAVALLNGGADPNKRGTHRNNFFTRPPLSHYSSSPLPDFPSPLRLAVKTGDLELVELLCKKGASVSVDAEAEEKETPVLMEAVSVGDMNMVRVLLDYGAQDGSFFSALYTATTLSKSTLQQRIETAPAASANAHPKTPEALRHELLTALSDAGISTDKLSNTKPRRTALFAAAQRGDLATVNLLIQHGAVYPFGHVPGTTTDATPLTVAVQGGHLEVVKALLDAGESVSVRCGVDLSKTLRTFYGDGLRRLRRFYGDGVYGLQWLTPLQMAVLGPPEIRGKNQSVKLLIAAGADVDPPPFLPASAEFAVQDPMFLKKPVRLSPVLLAAILPSEFTFSIPIVWQEQLEVFRTLWESGSRPFGHADSLYRTAAEFFAAIIDDFMATTSATTPETDKINIHRWQQLVRIAYETGGMAPSDPQTLFLRLLTLQEHEQSPCGQRVVADDPPSTTTTTTQVHSSQSLLRRRKMTCAAHVIFRLRTRCALGSLLQLSEDHSRSPSKMIDTGAARRHCARFGQMDAVQMLSELVKSSKGLVVDLDPAKMLTSCDSGGRSELHEVGQFLNAIRAVKASCTR